MILAIGGPMKEEPSKKPGGSMGMKAKKIGGIGGDYANESEDSEGPGMDNEEKMKEAARPLARAMSLPSSTVVECITAICNLMNSKPSGYESADSEEGDE